MVRQVDHTQPTNEEDHYIWSLYLNEMEVNHVKILVDTGSSINLLDEETFKSLNKR